MSVGVSQAVFDGIEFVRKSGETNMLAKYTVARIALDGGFFDTAVWVNEASDELYAKMIFERPIVVEGSG